MNVKIFDAHSDLLLKLWKNPKLNEYSDPSLQTPVQALLNGKAKVQCLAIFLPETVPDTIRLEMALVQIQLFHEKIAKYKRIKLIKNKADIDKLKSDETGIILTMEGCEPIAKNLRLRNRDELEAGARLPRLLDKRFHISVQDEQTPFAKSLYKRIVAR